MKRAIVSVINDLSTDQRVHKHCLLLTELGYDVLLIGRCTSTSLPLESRPYRMHRMSLPFESGPMFYACYNVGLLFHLLFKRSDLLVSNDLDTLLPNYLTHRIKRTKLLYDSHEFFTEVPELVKRPEVQRIWKRIESSILPRLKYALTVNRSIADLFKKEYGLHMEVLRNVPRLVIAFPVKTRSELGLPEDKKVVVLQGSGINVDRGAEEAVEAMRYLDNVVLLILGSGDVVDRLKQMVKEWNLDNKVMFKNRMPHEQMMAHTRVADLGLTLDKDTNINYRYSLPNKLFDYIHAGIPTLASNLPEVTRIVDEFQVGLVISKVEPQAIASKIKQMLESELYDNWRRNCLMAREQLNWKNESAGLRAMLHSMDE